MYYIMAKKYKFSFLCIILFYLMGLSGVSADEAASECERLDTKATGERIKYSLHADANGPLFFSGISCAISHRNRELCAMEMVSFDSTAKVIDYFTGEEIAIGKAYFWLDEKNSQLPITAFGSQESAEKYKAEKEAGVILDYTGLTEREFN